MWQSGTSPVDDAVEKIHEDIGDWYPGDEYVDWCGCSWFLVSDKQTELTDELLDFAREHSKPVMICESAPQGYDLQRLTRRNFDTMIDGEPGKNLRNLTADQIWRQWYQPFFDYVEHNEDVIRCVAYINVNWDAQPMWGPPYQEGYWGDTRVQANPLIKERWMAEISRGCWLNGSGRLFNQLGFQR